jgi:hypothetical protein
VPTILLNKNPPLTYADPIGAIDWTKVSADFLCNRFQTLSVVLKAPDSLCKRADGDESRRQVIGAVTSVPHKRVAEAALQTELALAHRPEEIAHLVTYLSSDFASATTGRALGADGGLVPTIIP